MLVLIQVIEPGARTAYSVDMVKTSVDLSRYAWLSVATALVTLTLKLTAYYLTDSVGLLSDALESTVNLAAAGLALGVLRWAAQPPDQEHAFGHEKAEYLSAGAEGALILSAALGILLAASQRFLHPMPLRELGLGFFFNASATVANATTAWVLLRAGQRHRSVALRADAHHLLGDVYSSLAVLAGVGLAAWSGWPFMDPLVALLAGLWVGWTGLHLLRTSLGGILDTSLPPETLQQIEGVLAPYRLRGLDFHALRTRQAGRTSFIQLHVLVPGAWSVLRGHRLLERIESELLAVVPGARLHTHLEPLEDPASFSDIDWPEL